MTQCIKYGLVAGLLSIGGSCVAAEEIPHTGSASEAPHTTKSAVEICYLCTEEYPAEAGVRISGNCEHTVCSQECYQLINSESALCGLCRKELSQPPVDAPKFSDDTKKAAPVKPSKAEKAAPAKLRSPGKGAQLGNARKARLDMLFLAASHDNFVRIAPIAKGFAAKGGITQAECDALCQGAAKRNKAALLATIKALRAKKN